MTTRYEPREGSGWEEGSSPIPGVRRWRLKVAPSWWLAVTPNEGAFVIARVRYGAVPEHTVPMLEDLGRIELDFGVHAWSIKGVHAVLPPSVGQCLLAMAVGPEGLH